MTDTTNLADRLEAFIPRGDGYNSDYANTLTEAVEALRSVQSAQVQGDGWIPVGEIKLSELVDGLTIPVVPVDLPIGTKLYAAPKPPVQGEK